VFRLNTDGTGYAVLKHFTRSDGAHPAADLTLSDGVLYGTTSSGGSSDVGTVFKVNTDGTGYTVLKHFYGSDGAGPWASLTLSGGLLYGTTLWGGSSQYGTVFKLNTNGTGYTVLKNFGGAWHTGWNPRAPVTLLGGVLYGTTGGNGTVDYGTVFKLNTDGTGYTVIKDFNLNSSAGSNPRAGLTLSGNVLYGTTLSGGSWGSGTVFKLNTDGSGYTLRKDFNYTEGSQPRAALTLSGSVLYGTTYSGADNGTVFRLNTDGTDFAVLKFFTFSTSSDGARPAAGLTLSGNVLYGTTVGGGSWGYGTVFKMDFPLTAQLMGGAIILRWSHPAFALQAAPSVTGTYTNIPGATSPYTNASAAPQRFFRLIGN
jgi:uncharacterized repeat protein (TIGR03803 family)